MTLKWTQPRIHAEVLLHELEFEISQQNNKQILVTFRHHQQIANNTCSCHGLQLFRHHSDLTVGPTLRSSPEPSANPMVLVSMMYSSILKWPLTSNLLNLQSIRTSIPLHQAFKVKHPQGANPFKTCQISQRAYRFKSHHLPCL